MVCEEAVRIAGASIPVFSVNTLVVGSGAAGLACAVRLVAELERCGCPEPAERVALLTHGLGTGTSRNAGSDKQTYYKLGTDPATPDTVLDLARTLKAGGCVHGDVALAEAANSLRCFHHLVEIGVPFPHSKEGTFVGYKTDFDPSRRATSAGPWTSRFMVDGLLGELRDCGVRVFERHHMLSIIVDEDGTACGALCADMEGGEAGGNRLVLFRAANVVVAGGGPGELFEMSVYPRGQMGPYAALLEAGAAAHNLTELQFGLGSLQPRWNLSGTYQQVIPRYFSTAPDGGDVEEFLNPWFDSMAELATSVFLKGYQWPFDPEKLPGSSLIDVLVQREVTQRGRRVFLDFRRNPVATGGLEEFELDDLGEEARAYLAKSGADQATPVERLAHMNLPSVELYRQMGVDLAEEPLEAGVCCQHCNGGFAVDWWWESTVPHLFVIGELAGTHGISRPGGAALNAGQVGALRAAQRIAHVYHGEPVPSPQFHRAVRREVERCFERIEATRRAADGAPSCEQARSEVRRRMSRNGGMLRSGEGVKQALEAAREQRARMRREGLRTQRGWLEAARTHELVLAQLAFLEAVRAMLERGAGSRGSHLVLDPAGRLPHPGLEEHWRFLPENEELREEILRVRYDAAEDRFGVETVRPRPIPESEHWFEQAWSRFRSGEVFRERDGDTPRASREPDGKE